MLFFILPIILATSILFTRLQHPLSIGLCLLVQTTIISIARGLNNNSFWFSYILFLIFLGAILVLFIYVASLASNEPFKVSTTAFTTIIIFLIFSTILILIKDPLYVSPNINIFASSASPNIFTLDPTTSLVRAIYRPPTSPFTLFIVLYLLLTLVVIVKIVTLSSSPLRLSSY